MHGRETRADAHSGVGQLHALLALSSEPTVLLDSLARVSGWNAAAENLLGWSSAELLGQPLVPTVLPDDDGRFSRLWGELATTAEPRSVSATARTRDGTAMPLTMRLAGVAHVAQLAGAVLMLRAVPGTVSSASGHPTVLLGHDDLVRRLTNAVPQGSARAVAIMEVDDLARLQESSGPGVADRALRQLAARLATAAAGVSFGQWIDDEFVAVLDDPDARGVMTALMDRLQQAARQPILVDDQQVELRISAGLATGEAGDRRGLLISAADALTLAKLTGGDRTVWFDPSMVPAGSPDLRRAAELRRGIELGELRLHFQPIIEVATNALRSVEALVRWQHPGVGLVQPSGFIELAERTGDIVPLGAWVTQQACLVAAELAPMRVSINLSARQLADPGVLDMLAAAIAESGCDPDRIEIEVTETALMLDLALARETLVGMKALGVGLALDDFGTGYSSLVYLKHFPVDHIKIDRSFVAGLGDDPDDTAIVASTIALAHSIGIRCVAEGVETAEQLQQLSRLHCDYAQGYAISRPLPVEELREWQPPALPEARPGASAPRPAAWPS